jgi:hypothetical protein
MGSPSPLVKKTLITKVKSKINTIALSDLSTILNGIFDKATIRKLNTKRNAKEAKLLQKKIETIKIVASRILVLPSSL